MEYPKSCVNYKGDSGFGRSKSIFPHRLRVRSEAGEDTPFHAAKQVNHGRKHRVGSLLRRKHVGGDDAVDRTRWRVSQSPEKRPIDRRAPSVAQTVQARPSLALRRTRSGGLLRVAAVGSEPRGCQGWGLPERHDKPTINHRDQAIRSYTACQEVIQLASKIFHMGNSNGPSGMFRAGEKASDHVVLTVRIRSPSLSSLEGSVSEGSACLPIRNSRCFA